MYYGNSKQFQLYDSILIHDKNYAIEGMVMEAAKALHKYIPNHKKVVILCGKGNNGADGLALATLIKNNVCVYYFGDSNTTSKANQYYLNQLSLLHIPIHRTINTLSEDLKECDVIVDGLFGTGFNGQLSNEYISIISLVNRSSKRVISIDLPSGMICNTGEVISTAIMADQTITFIASKIGFLNPDAQPYLGEVSIEEILFHQDVFDKVSFSLFVNEKDIKIKKRLYDGHKGTYGKLCCNVGSIQYPGAAILSIGSALYTGCGYVAFCGNSHLKAHLVSLYPEVIYQENYDKANAILFGCGKGWNKNTLNELKSTIINSSVPILIDADGINCLSDDLSVLEYKRSPIILTPHVKEMERLCKGDSVIAAIEFARKYEVIVVLKGASTLVTDGKNSYRIASGDRAMAVAGMGDCLSGIIASLLAQQYNPLQACLYGVYIHGLCGSYLAKKNYTILPSCLIQEIPKVMCDLNRKTED